MKCFYILLGLTITALLFGQTDATLVKSFATPTALVHVFVYANPTLQDAEEKLLQLRTENPEKRIFRVALYQSEVDEKATEDQFVAGHITLKGWKYDYYQQKSTAAAMAEAVAVNGYALSRLYDKDGHVSVQTPAGFSPLQDISCGTATMNFEALASGTIGPHNKNYVEIYFQAGKELTSELDVRCLATEIGFTDLTPIMLSVSTNPLFPFDTRFPRFNRFLAFDYAAAVMKAPLAPDRITPDYFCTSMVPGDKTIHCGAVPLPSLNGSAGN